MPHTIDRGTSRTRAPAQDAVTLLEADHKAVALLFTEFARTRSRSDKHALVAEICDQLDVLLQIEEEHFYPAVRALLQDQALIAEASIEHAGIKDMIWQLRDLTPAAELFDAKVKVLSEYVDHHVAEEHGAMFPKVRAASLDLLALGAQMAVRKAALTAAAHRAMAAYPPRA